jgi:hypothetical protein
MRMHKKRAELGGEARRKGDVAVYKQCGFQFTLKL